MILFAVLTRLTGVAEVLDDPMGPAVGSARCRGIVGGRRTGLIGAWRDGNHLVGTVETSTVSGGSEATVLVSGKEMALKERHCFLRSWLVSPFSAWGFKESGGMD